MVCGPEVRGHKVLTVQPYKEFTPENLGLNMEAESWWVVSHGHWYPRRQLLNVQVSGLLVCWCVKVAVAKARSCVTLLKVVPFVFST